MDVFLIHNQIKALPSYHLNAFLKVIGAFRAWAGAKVHNEEVDLEFIMCIMNLCGNLLFIDDQVEELTPSEVSLNYLGGKKYRARVNQSDSLLYR